MEMRMDWCAGESPWAGRGRDAFIEHGDSMHYMEHFVNSNVFIPQHFRGREGFTPLLCVGFAVDFLRWNLFFTGW
jgi:hypothetical protein